MRDGGLKGIRPVPANRHVVLISAKEMPKFRRHQRLGMNHMATFILIPGGWQGGWVYQQVAEILAAHGHKALPITLSGLGDAPAPMANLETHIGEVVSAVKSQQGDVVLVGQSYGGMVVSGAADAAPSQIRALVYVDAYVP